jgi:type II secretory pathway component PulM
MKAWWNRLQPRERILLGAAAAVVALTLLWILVWEPLNASRQALRDELAAQQALLDWLERIEPGAGGEIRVSFEQAAFVELMTWLETLIQTRPLVVVRFEASRGNQSGRVDSLVVLRLIGGG